MQGWQNDVVNWLLSYQTNLIWSVIMILVYLTINRYALPRLERHIEKSKLKSSSAIKGILTIRLVTAVLTFAVILLAWGIDFSGLLVLSTSIITLTGVALFASWSLLSNVTAYFLLLTNVAYRRGNYVRIVDGDNFMEGYIADINVFSTRILTASRETIMYPNNLLLTRPVLINPKQQLGSMGKVVNPERHAKENDTSLPATANVQEKT